MELEEIIKMHEGFIRKIANKFYNVDKEDLYQAGVIGLLKAVKNYHNNGTTKFSTYAYEYIFGEMYQMVYKSQTVKVSKDTLRMYQKIEMTRSALAQKLHKVPSNEEVALFLEMSPTFVDQIITSGSMMMLSLDETSNGEERSYYETIGEEETVSMDDSLTLQDSIKNLNPEEQRIIEYRYFNDLTQSETAKKLNMTQVMVSRYEKKGLQKMREYYNMVP